jgi:Holliday junction resolvase RusA-like endonuclease
MRHLTIESDIRVKPKGRPRFYRGIALTDPATREFERTVKALFRSFCCEPFVGPIKVELECFFAKPKKTEFSYPPRGDCDNMFKSVADAGNEVLWKDDSQIVRLICSKKWSTEDGFRITVMEALE